MWIFIKIICLNKLWETKEKKFHIKIISFFKIFMYIENFTLNVKYFKEIFFLKKIKIDRIIL